MASIEPPSGPGELADLIVDVWTGGILSPELFGAMLATGLLVPLWIFSDDLALPTIVGLLVIGPFAMGTLPGDLQQVAVGVIVIGLAAAVFEAGRRYLT